MKKKWDMPSGCLTTPTSAISTLYAGIVPRDDMVAITRIFETMVRIDDAGIPFLRFYTCSSSKRNEISMLSWPLWAYLACISGEPCEKPDIFNHVLQRYTEIATLSDMNENNRNSAMHIMSELIYMSE